MSTQTPAENLKVSGPPTSQQTDNIKPETGNPAPVAISAAELEYKHLLSYFKYLVTLTAGFAAVIIAIGAWVFWTNIKDVRQDAKDEATRIATVESKNRVSQAFDEQHVNALILRAAEEKVGAITDKIINQQLVSRLRPMEQRITLLAEISDCDARMRLGFRDGLENLNKLLASTKDPDVLRFGRSILTAIRQDYETRIKESGARLGMNGLQLLQRYMMNQNRPHEVPSDLRAVVQMIRHETDLNAVSGAFVAFRDLTGDKAEMFDFAAASQWCSQNQSKCQ